MEKKQLSRILSRSGREAVGRLAAPVRQNHAVALLKEPQKTLCMLKLRDPVQGGLFYLGEALVCEAAVEVDGRRGMAVLMGDDLDKVLDMAVIDAAFNAGCAECGAMRAALLALEAEQTQTIERENARHLATMVNFDSLDHDTP